MVRWAHPSTRALRRRTRAIVPSARRAERADPRADQDRARPRASGDRRASARGLGCEGRGQSRTRRPARSGIAARDQPPTRRARLPSGGTRSRAAVRLRVRSGAGPLGGAPDVGGDTGRVAARDRPTNTERCTRPALAREPPIASQAKSTQAPLGTVAAARIPTRAGRSADPGPLRALAVLLPALGREAAGRCETLTESRSRAGVSAQWARSVPDHSRVNVACDGEEGGARHRITTARTRGGPVRCLSRPGWRRPSPRRRDTCRRGQRARRRTACVCGAR